MPNKSSKGRSIFRPLRPAPSPPAAVLRHKWGRATSYEWGGHNRLVELAQTRPPVPAWEQALRQFGARFFEAAPGLGTWILLLAPGWIPIIFHSTRALVVASVVLVFDAYWVLRAIGVVTGVYGSMLKLRRDGKRDWLALCREEAAQGRPHPLQFLPLSGIPPYTPPSPVPHQ